MKKLLTATLIVFFLTTHFFCKTQSGTNKSTKAMLEHNSSNSLDWDGVYRGILPCADCKGIQKTVYLNKDLSYRVKKKYLGKEGDATEYKGKFSWNNQGTTITLTEAGQPALYLVGENTLTQLDPKGNRITGQMASNYVLSKENYVILEKYWKLIELNGLPVVVDSSFRKEPHIIFKDEEGRFVGNGGCNGFSGTYELSGLNRITLSKAMVTQMVCPNMDIESQLLRVLQIADNYSITADMLVLNKARMAPLARFKTVYMK